MQQKTKFLRNNLPHTGLDLFCAAVGAAAVIYEIARAARVSFTIDEASSFLIYIRNGFLGLFDFNEANNHFLNSALTKIAYLVGGNPDLVLRLPNLAGFVLYLVFGFLLLKKLVRPIYALFGFVLLGANPYLLDFFSLCRGYGLSLGFLMAAAYLFYMFLDRHLPEGGKGLQFLTTALIAAAVPVFSNFALLNIYLSLALVAFMGFILINRRSSTVAADPAPRRPRRAALIGAIAVVIAAFNLLVISQDVDLSPNLFEPVSVRLIGASPIAGIAVLGCDYKERDVPFEAENGGWKIGPGHFLTALRFDIPKSALAGAQDLEITIGGTTFPVNGDKLRAEAEPHGSLVMKSHYQIALPRSRLPLFEPAINWAGSGVHVREVLRCFLRLAGIFIGLGALLSALGWIFIKTKTLRPGQWPRLAIPTLGLGAVIAYPVFMLKESPEFIWGGETGFAHDTVRSLIEGSFYGHLYFPGQIKAAGLVLGLSAVAIFGAAAVVHVRKRSLARIAPAAISLAVMILVSIATMIQHTLFGNPFLLGRTALFYIPLFVLFLVFSVDALGDAGRGKGAIGTVALALAAALAAGHFALTANTSMTQEWHWDAQIKDVVTDLERLKAERFAEKSTLTLGVDGDFIMNLRYYVDQRKLSWLDVHDYDERADDDLYLLRVPFDPARMVLVKSYPASGNILVQAKPKGR